MAVTDVTFRRLLYGRIRKRAFWILDAKVARPPHATWYVRRVSLPPALQALTCRLGAPAHLCDERAFSYPGRFRLVGQSCYPL